MAIDEPGQAAGLERGGCVWVTDPLVYASVAMLLVITKVCATWVPARRAMRVSVVDTLAVE